MRNSSFCYSVAIFVLLVAAEARHTFLLAEEAIQVPLGKRQLFLDDFCVGSMDGLQRTMHCPEKRGQSSNQTDLGNQTCRPAARQRGMKKHRCIKCG